MWTRLRRSSADERRADDGFTLVEVLAAMVVLAILATSIMIVLGQSLQASRTSRQRVAAANLIAAQMDLARDRGAAALTVGTSTITPAPVDGVQYTLSQTVRWSSGTAAATDSCAGPGTVLFKRISITATWSDMGSTRPVRSDSVVTPAIGDVNGNAITIPVRVRDRNNAPRSGVPVNLTGTSLNSTQFTDEFGCVVFGNVPPGSYSATVTSSTAPATVNWQGASANTATVGTSVGGTWLTTTEFQWDTSATLDLTPTAPDAQHPVPAGIGATIANSNLANPGYKSYATAASNVVASSLFPFSSGYDSWAGTCTDADPQVAGGARVSPTTVVAPGGTANVALATRAVDVTLTTTGSASKVGRQLVAVHTSTAGCGPVSYSGVNVGQVLTLPGTTSAAGVLKVALPYGAWQFRVIAGNPGPTTSSTWQTVNITPGASPLAVAVNVR